MHALTAAIVLSSVLLANCVSKPTVTVAYSGLGKKELKDKTVAVGGLTAKDISMYPGQVHEITILSDAGTAMQHRLKH